VVDLGAGSGTTAGAVFAERPFARVWTFDIDEAALNWAGAFVAALDPPVATRWHPMLMDSAAAVWPYRAGQLDMLMIDSSHEYAHTVAELAAWLPMLRPGGLVWCHDYRGTYPGVTQAVDEAVARGEVELIAVRGLGWGGRKP
jgi:predicted O-methyltransferase YrrM